jgi:hypothetical protein
MGSGIDTVFKASKRGGFYQATGPDHIMGLIRTSFGSGDSTNPFQDLGLGEDMIFSTLDLESFAPVQDRIREIFQDFETQELAALQQRPDNLRIIETSTAEAAILVFVIDLETEDNFTLTVGGNVSGVTVSLLG